MKSKKGTLIILIGLLIVLLTGTFLVVLLNVTGQETEETDKPNLTMFSAYTDNELYQNIPALVTETSKIHSFSSIISNTSYDYILFVSKCT